MSMFKLALQNFKASFKSYLSLIISLSFTTMILANFINLLSSGTFAQLGGYQTRNIEAILQVISFVIACFMLFFVWYATNVFLTKRKKEIGTYVFMGLSNQKIAKLYMIEISLIGLASLGIGLGFGFLTSQLFAMIIARMSDIAVEIKFNFTFASFLWTSAIFSVIYMLFVIKGYVNIIRSSVLDMVSANKQNELVIQNNYFLVVKAILGIFLLGSGLILAIKASGMKTMENIFIATVLVIVGIYLLFGGLVPFILQTLAKHKPFLYRKERILWINNMIFRVKKNYRTYAMVCVLMLCSLTALAFGFAMKQRSDNINHFENTYTYQIMADQDDLQDEFTTLIQKQNEIDYFSKVEMLLLNDEYTDNKYKDEPYTVLSYTQIKQLAEDVGLEFNLDNPEDDEYIKLNQLYLMSFADIDEYRYITIDQKKYSSIATSTTPYLGYYQEVANYMIVNDKVFQELQALGQSVYLYNYRLSDPYNYAASLDDINSHPHCLGLVKIDPARNENAWINTLFSVSFFVFLVFVFASGCILFMKIYNDAVSEKERYIILQKIGIDGRIIKKAIASELKITFLLPLIVMSIASFFAVQAIANAMRSQTLWFINILSLVIIYLFFIVCYFLVKKMYQSNVKL